MLGCGEHPPMAVSGVTTSKAYIYFDNVYVDVDGEKRCYQM